MKKITKENGITLVALIITIVVLLILAAVAINSIQSDGIISYAENVQNEYKASQNEEDTILEDLDFLVQGQVVSIWSGDVAEGFEKGEGTEENPYVILKANQLAYLAQEVKNGNTYEGKYFVLAKPLNLNNVEWTPIGNATTQFKGIFDGQNLSISNLKIDAIEGKNIGLFGYTANGEIKNLTLTNADVKGFVTVGTIVGNVGSSKMTNLTVTGLVKVEATQGAGGMLGRYASNTLTDLTVNVDTGSYVKTINKNEGYENAKDYAGGIIGFLESGNTTVTNAKSNIDVIGNNFGVGGITGLVHQGNKLINCSSSGKITLDQCPGDGSELTIGGIAGVWYNGSGYNIVLQSCVFTGNLSSTDIDGNSVTEFENEGLVGCPYSSTETGELIIN